MGNDRGRVDDSALIRSKVYYLSAVNDLETQAESRDELSGLFSVPRYCKSMRELEAIIGNISFEGNAWNFREFMGVISTRYSIAEVFTITGNQC